MLIALLVFELSQCMPLRFIIMILPVVDFVLLLFVYHGPNYKAAFVSFQDYILFAKLFRTFLAKHFNGNFALFSSPILTSE